MSRKLPALLKPAYRKRRLIYRLGRNKYVIATIAFVVWVTFFDRNDLITQVGYVQHLHELKTRKTYLQHQIARTNEDLHELLSNPERLKKFAREKYLMKKSNEDVYVIESKKSQESEK